LATYRLYTFRSDGREDDRDLQQVLPLDCVGDAEAIRLAAREGGGYMELWRHGRLVKIFEPDSGA
jgi:hypothetical protein